MNRLYKINYKTSSDKGITLTTTKGNVLLDAGLDLDVYTDEFREYISINKILSLPYKFGCVSNKYNNCNLYINNRKTRRVLEDIREDKNRGLVALIFTDTYIVMGKDIYDFLEITRDEIGKTYAEAFTQVIDQEAMNLELISTVDKKLQINISKIKEDNYESNELDSVFSMFDRKERKEVQSIDINQEVNSKALEEVIETPKKKPGRPKNTGRRAGK